MGTSCGWTVITSTWGGGGAAGGFFLQPAPRSDTPTISKVRDDPKAPNPRATPPRLRDFIFAPRTLLLSAMKGGLSIQRGSSGKCQVLQLLSVILIGQC